jgi:hypothetical protein
VSAVRDAARIRVGLAALGLYGVVIAAPIVALGEREGP